MFSGGFLSFITGKKGPIFLTMTLKLNIKSLYPRANIEGRYMFCFVFSSSVFAEGLIGHR